MTTTQTTPAYMKFATLKRAASMSEGLIKSELTPDRRVRVECLYQRPVKYGRPQKPVAEALCFRWTAVRLKDHERIALNQEEDVLSLLEGLSLEALQERRHADFAQLGLWRES